MPPYYIGGGGMNPYSGFGKPPVNPPTPIGQNSDLGSPGVSTFPNTPMVPSNLPGGKPVGMRPLGPGPRPAPAAPAPLPPNVLPAQSVRATGDAKGYDSSYLQNLATAIGGLFSRPQGNLSFNPLSDLSSISPASGMGGNAPLPGLPSTWLQDALNGLGFSFSPVTPTATGPRDPAGGADDNGRGRRGGPNLQ